MICKEMIVVLSFVMSCALQNQNFKKKGSLLKENDRTRRRRRKVEKIRIRNGSKDVDDDDLPILLSIPACISSLINKNKKKS